MANNHRYDPSAQSIFKATKGILFFGTPHKGSKNTTFGSYISSIVDIVTPKGAALTEQYVALKKDGESLKQISETFIGLCKEIRILTRFETRTKFSQIVSLTFRTLVVVIFLTKSMIDC